LISYQVFSGFHDQEHDQEAVVGSRSIEPTDALFVDPWTGGA
jgi:hypothetical protein